MTILNPATGAETQVALVAETTVGTTPTTPAMVVLPFVKLDLDFNQTTLEDNSVYADRMEHFTIAGNRKVAGSLSGNLSHTNFSPIIQTAMFNTWTSNVIKVGSTLNTVTLEKFHKDIGKGFVATGCFADKLAIKMPASGLVTFDATISGINYTTETTALSSTPTAPVVEIPYTVLNATITEGGTPIAYLTGVDVTLDNKSISLDVMGSQIPVGYVPGMSKVTGTATAYVPDLTLYNKFQNQTGSSLSVTLTDGTNTLQINIPNLIYTAAKIPIQGQGAVLMSLTFTGLKDSTTGSNLVITRS